MPGAAAPPAPGGGTALQPAGTAQQPGGFPAGPYPGGPQSPGVPQLPGSQQFTGSQQFSGTAQFQGAPPLTGQPQPGFDQRPGPGQGPGGPGGPAPAGFGGPARRRITDAWARLGTLTPAGGMASMRRAGGGAPSETRAGLSPTENADPSAQPSSSKPSSNKPSSNRNKALVAGAGVLAVIAVGGVIVAPKLLGGSSDPGCAAYSGTALTAYNKTIDDLNAQASQSVLSADMSTTITELTSAIAQAKSTSVKSALNGLLTELKDVQAGVQAGSVPAATVNALNAASAKADNAC